MPIALVLTRSIFVALAGPRFRTSGTLACAGSRAVVVQNQLPLVFYFDSAVLVVCPSRVLNVPRVHFFSKILRRWVELNLIFGTLRMQDERKGNLEAYCGYSSKSYFRTI